MIWKSKRRGPAIARAAAIGIVAGLRSQLPLAFLARTAKEPVLSHPLVRRAIYLGAGSELVIDKMPFTPSRLNPGSLFGRATMGALAGGLLANRLEGSAALGAVIGSAGAMAGSYAGYYVRKQLGEWTGMPDPVFAVLEDGIALTAGSMLVQTGRK
jgi:uncharacterized membrane protein